MNDTNVFDFTTFPVLTTQRLVLREFKLLVHQYRADDQKDGNAKLKNDQ